MDQSELLTVFRDFLINQKNYPSNSILPGKPIISGNTRIHPDLLLLDIEIGEYIGIVEFKENIDPKIKSRSHHVLKKYREQMRKPEIPLYLVFSTTDGDFGIMTDNQDGSGWIKISKDLFPEFATLSANRKIEQKEYAEDQIEDVIRADERKAFTKRGILGNLVVGGLFVLGFIAYSGWTYFNSISEWNSNRKLEKADVNFPLDTIGKSLGKFDSMSYDSIANVQALRIDLLEEKSKNLEQLLESKSELGFQIYNLQSDLITLRERIDMVDESSKIRDETNLFATQTWLSLASAVVGMILYGIFSYVASRLLSRNNR